MNFRFKKVITENVIYQVKRLGFKITFLYVPGIMFESKISTQ